MLKSMVSRILLTLLLASLLTLAFNVRPVKSDYVWTETIYVRADGSIQPPTAPISSVDNVTYTLTDNIAGNVPSSSKAMVIERDNIIIDGAGYTLQDTEASDSRGIELTGRSNVTIKNMKITAFYIGIWLGSSSNNSVSGNNITANYRDGIWLYSSSNNSVSDNTVANNFNGIVLFSSSNYNSVSGNNITANYRDGIFLGSSSNYNSVSGNNIMANDWCGIWLDSSSNNSVSGNNMTNNACGIEFYVHSSNNSVSGNTVANNEYGIWLYFSSDNSISGNNITANNVDGIWLGMSFDNTIYHNDFISNTQQVYDYSWENPGYPPSTNMWDDGYPSGGNYWSDYAGVDEKKGVNQDEPGSDGLGDTPYVIDADQDHYPLMYQWPARLLCDVNGDGSVDMQDISLLADAFLAEPGYPLWNPNCDVNNDNTIDMADISLAIDHFMQT